MNVPKARIMIVDDDRLVASSLATSLSQLGYDCLTIDTGDQAIELALKQELHLALVDVRLPGRNGLEVLRDLKTRLPRLPVLVMTAYGSIDNAVLAMRGGADDYLTKPISDVDLAKRVRNALDLAAAGQKKPRDGGGAMRALGHQTLVANHPRMQKVIHAVEAAAPTRATILIQGESGTGKTVMARAIHQISPRSDHPFVEVSCGSLPDTLLESELFGYEVGAFTGADRQKIGKFEFADKGTIFLDEIANATPALQVKLLRILQDRIFERLGSNESIDTDIRLILATNANLEKAVQKGQFREDLFYRINVIAIDMPPLRERRDDILALAQLFLNRYSAEYGKGINELDDEVQEFLYSFSWPGNVRELENAIEHAVIMTTGNVIGRGSLPPRYTEGIATHGTGRMIKPLKEALELPEREFIIRALKLNGGNRRMTAEMLCVNRTTLFNKMKKYGLFDEDYSS